MRITGINPYSHKNITQDKIRKQSSKQNPFQSSNYPQIIDLNLLNHTNNIAFTRRIEEHRSWGANIDPVSKEVSFKIFTYPDVQSVNVKIYDRNNPEKFKIYPLKNNGEGIFTTGENGISGNEVKEGDRYSFLIKKRNGHIDEVKDPYAKRQGNSTSKDFLNYSILYDNSVYNWQNQKSWIKSSERITRYPNNKGLSIKDASIYEMHIDTLTQEGTFEAAKEKLHKIKDLGFNTIEIMPNENTFSFNWGYDGVDKFAPPEHRGGPDKLKELIDYAHGLELNVVMDYVPNHLGPDGAQLKRTGPYIKGNNAFGESFNFEGENSKYVRDYIVNAAMNWIDNYKVDGLRLDMTKFMESDFTMKEIAAEINHHFPSVFLIAEDSRQGINVNHKGYFEDYSQLHDKRVVSRLHNNEMHKKDAKRHCDYIDKIDRTIKEFIENKATYHPMLKNLGYDSEWDFSYHHSLDDAIFAYNETKAIDRWKLANLTEAIFQSQNNVKYVTSHDETGNRDGTRPIVKYLAPKLNLNSYIVLNDEDKKRIKQFAKLKHTSLADARRTILAQKTQLATEELVKLLSEGKLDSYKHKKYDQFHSRILSKLDIKKESNITYSKLIKSYERSVAQFRMAQALTFAIPGPKMVFQGDENLDITSFRFFRKFESIDYEHYLKTEKGYEPGTAALMASKLDGIQYSNKTKDRMEQYAALTKDLNKLNKENPALTKGKLVLNKDGSKSCIIHDNAIGIHIKDANSDNEFYVVTNFGCSNYPNIFNEEYNLPFPEGKWVEALNTEDTKYGGCGRYSNVGNVFSGSGLSDDDVKTPIKLGSTSTIYFKKIA